MKKNKIGSLLIVSDDDKSSLVGIFTERDLLNKVDLIRAGNAWESPIRTVMSHPVKTIDLGRIDQAEEILLKSGYRHLPVTTRGHGGHTRIVGVISMRDLFKNLAEKAIEQRRVKDARAGHVPGRRKTVCISSDDRALLKMIRHLDPHVAAFPIEDLEGDAERVRPDYSKLDFLIFDIDGLTTADWSETIKKVSRKLMPNRILIVYDPIQHSPRVKTVLLQMTKSKKVQAYQKPINLLALTAYLTK